MPYINRGASFVAYYGVPSGTPEGWLNGAQWLHTEHCGTFVIGETSYDLRCFFFYKDEFPDSFGVNAEAYDIGALFVDGLLISPLIQALMLGDAGLIASALEDTTIHPITRYLVAMDLQNGMSGEEIIETRAAILDPKFLGFTFGQVVETLPEECYYSDYDNVCGEHALLIRRGGLEAWDV